MSKITSGIPETSSQNPTLWRYSSFYTVGICVFLQCCPVPPKAWMMQHFLKESSFIVSNSVGSSAETALVLPEGVMKGLKQ